HACDQRGVGLDQARAVLVPLVAADVQQVRSRDGPAPRSGIAACGLEPLQARQRLVRLNPPERARNARVDHGVLAGADDALDVAPGGVRITDDAIGLLQAAAD